MNGLCKGIGMELASDLTLLDTLLMMWVSCKSAPFTEGLLPLGCQIAVAPEVTHAHPQSQWERVRSFPEFHAKSQHVSDCIRFLLLKGSLRLLGDTQTDVRLSHVVPPKLTG